MMLKLVVDKFRRLDRTLCGSNGRDRSVVYVDLGKAFDVDVCYRKLHQNARRIRDILLLRVQNFFWSNSPEFLVL